jgi:hypothetical protein
MPSITINREQIVQLADFLKANPDTKPFVAKDQGAYLGASVGEKDNVIFYFPGCDPKKNANYYEKSRTQFGGDDFGEHLGREFFLRCAEDPKINNLKVNVTKASIKMSAYE